MNIFFERKYVIQGIIILTGLILLARLFYIQVVDDSYFLSANNNVLRKIVVYPARGIIYDRTGRIMVQNEPVYDLMVIPRQVKEVDTAQFCSLIGIEKHEFIERLEKARKYSPYKSSIFEKQLSARTFAGFQERLFEYPGFYVQNRTVRKYPDSIAGQVLGYIGEVDENMMKKTNYYYQLGDYIGISGVERSYENILRGQRGIKMIMVDVFNREQGSYENGAYDTLAIAGEKITSSLDLEIQKLGERLMKNKKGSIVAIEPSTGEILAFVSSPGYDPNLLVGRERGSNYRKLLLDKDKPLFIRPIMAQYPPGSIFKAVEALVGQQEGLIYPETRFPCGGGYRYGNRVVRCTHVHSALNLMESIQLSCNPYYCHVFKKLIDNGNYGSAEANFIAWRKHIEKFGIGVKLGIDLPNELKGLLPTHEFYDKYYGAGRWKSSNIISLSIGQGELGITPLQMANVMAIIANKGYYFSPHLVKAIGNKNQQKPEYTTRHYAGIDSNYFDVVIDGMQKVVEGGTATYARIQGITMCGKTGTAQNPHGKDHSVFVAFAPRENPKIAIAVVVENAGFGSVWAAPIASLLVEQYLTDTITRPKYYVDRLLNADLINQPQPAPGAKKEEAKDE
jgi:penicillin-binding protein 2